MEKIYIKIYTPLCIIRIETKIGDEKVSEILFSDLENKERIVRDANDTKINMVRIDGKAVNRYDIKEVDDYTPEGSDIKMRIATRDPYERKLLARRSLQKYQRVGKEIETIQEGTNWLERYKK